MGARFTSTREKNASCKGPSASAASGRKKKTQAETSGAASQLLLHGRQMPRLLQDHHRVQPRPDCRGVCWVFYSAVSANRWQGQADRGMLFPAQATLGD